MDHTDDVEFLLKKVLSLQSQVRSLYFLVLVLFTLCVFLLFRTKSNSQKDGSIGNATTMFSSAVSEGPTAEEAVESATLIIYGTSKVIKNKNITYFDRVIWANKDIPINYKLGDIIDQRRAESGTNYGEGQVWIYQGDEGKDHVMTWHVHGGIIHSWNDKSLDEFEEELKDKE